MIGIDLTSRINKCKSFYRKDDTMEDNLIIKYIQHKNEKGLELLIEHYGGLITSIVRKHLYSFRDAQDECIDDILLAIWDNVNMFDNDKNSFKNWVSAISKYKCIDYKRRLLNIPFEEEIHENILETSVSIEENLILEELRNEINDILKCLPLQDREIISRYYLQDKDVFIISKELLIKPSAIYNRLSRGRKKLKKLFSKIEYL